MELKHPGEIAVKDNERAVHFNTVTEIRRCFQQILTKGALSTKCCIQLLHTFLNIFQK